MIFNTRFPHTETLIENSENDQSSENEDDEDVPRKRRGKPLMNDSGDEDAEKDKQVEAKKNTRIRTRTNADNQFGLVNYYTKKVVLKIWGFYNERFKQCWEKYAAETQTSSGLYLMTVLLVEIICKYISRKKAKMAEQDKEEVQKIESNVRKTNAIPEAKKSRSEVRNLIKRSDVVEAYGLRTREKIQRPRYFYVRAIEF